MTTARAAGLVLALLLSGCGTLIGYAGDREVRIITNPPGATLLVDSIPVEGVSPLVVLLDPAEEHRIDGRLDGLRGGTQIKRTSSRGIVVLDILFTLGLGISVDWATGALYDFPETVVVNLGRARAPEPPLAAQYPPPPALMPHVDHLAPAPPPPPAPAITPKDAAPCEVCGEPVVRGAACQVCGQPPR